jgi:hypothetical protein
LFTFDEGDRHLHPLLVKKLPKSLEDIRCGIEKLLEQKGASKVSVQFFLSTHSPFLISALHSADLKMRHKVYLLQDGKTIEPRGGYKGASRSGYSSDKSLFAANQMLGVELNDLIPDKFILSEESVHVLLKSFAKKIGAECDYFEYTTSGDDNTVKRANSLIEQRKAIPFFNSEIFVIFDGSTDDVNKKELEKLKKGLGDNLIYVRHDTDKELETCYPREIVNDFINERRLPKWDRAGTFKQYLATALIKDSMKQGKMKSDLAKYVVENSDEETLRRALPALNKIFPKET